MNWDDLVTKAKESGFVNTVLPEGQYTVEVTESEARKSKAGAHQVRLQYTITEGPYQGEEVSDFLTFSDKAAGMAGQKILAVGGTEFMTKLSQDFGPSVNDPGLKVIASLFDGKTLLIDVTVAKDGKGNFFRISDVVGAAAPSDAPVAQHTPTQPAPNSYAAPPTNLPV